MVSLKYDFPEDFFDEEIRSDYLVSHEIKQVWAVQLDLLQELIRVCNKHSLNYYAMGGTLLGAVRHHGYIPWDDDIDIVMKRKDYQQLCRIAELEFQYPYFLQTERSDLGFSRAFARLRNSETTGIQKREFDNKVPFNQGIFIDIFPMDNIPDDPEEKSVFLRDAIKKSKMARRFGNGTYKYNKNQKNSRLTFKGVVKSLFANQARSFLLKFQIHNPFVFQYEKYIVKYNNVETNEIGPLFLNKSSNRLVWSQSDFAETLLVPFENIQIAVPSGYENILKIQYGDWRKMVRSKTAHGDMIFDVNISYKDYYLTNS